ncbi:ABC transporter permease [Candidatus Microgenomates bacterium]|nr:ABC transporter permease [Candidatus Microgenomates bacterium]
MAKAYSATEVVKPVQRSRLAWAISDSLVLIKRSLTHIIRNMDQLLGVAFMPIMFTLLFRYVFGGAINTGGVSYVNFLIAGILVQSAGFGATTTAIAITMDMKRGLIDRLRSLPTMTSAVLVGHTVSDLVRNTISSIIMILVGLAVGFRPTANIWEWLLALGMLLLFTFAMSWLSVIMGLIAKTQEAVQWLTFVFIFPLTFASSAFVPTAGMPRYLRAFAENQPVTHVVESIRAWLVGTPIGNHGWLALIWCAGILVVSTAVASHMFRHRGR